MNVRSSNFLIGLEVEINRGWVLFGLHLVRGVQMVLEQLPYSFSEGWWMFPLFRWCWGVSCVQSFDGESGTRLKMQRSCIAGHMNQEYVAECFLLPASPDQAALSKIESTTLWPLVLFKMNKNTFQFTNLFSVQSLIFFLYLDSWT